MRLELLILLAVNTMILQVSEASQGGVCKSCLQEIEDNQKIQSRRIGSHPFVAVGDYLLSFEAEETNKAPLELSKAIVDLPSHLAVDRSLEAYTSHLSDVLVVRTFRGLFTFEVGSGTFNTLSVDGEQPFWIDLLAVVPMGLRTLFVISESHSEPGNYQRFLRVLEWNGESSNLESIADFDIASIGVFESLNPILTEQGLILFGGTGSSNNLSKRILDIFSSDISLVESPIGKELIAAYSANIGHSAVSEPALGKWEEPQVSQLQVVHEVPDLSPISTHFLYDVTDSDNPISIQKDIYEAYPIGGADWILQEGVGALSSRLALFDSATSESFLLDLPEGFSKVLSIGERFITIQTLNLNFGVANFVFDLRSKSIVPLDAANEEGPYQEVKVTSSGLNIPSLLYLPQKSCEKPGPALVYVHGGSFSDLPRGLSSIASDVAPITVMGLPTLFMNYSGDKFLASGSRDPERRYIERDYARQEILNISDGGRFLADHRCVDPKRVFLIGHSSGANLVTVYHLSEQNELFDFGGVFSLAGSYSLGASIEWMVPTQVYLLSEYFDVMTASYNAWARNNLPDFGEDSLRASQDLRVGVENELARRKANGVEPLEYTTYLTDPKQADRVLGLRRCRFSKKEPFLIVHGTEDFAAPYKLDDQVESEPIRLYNCMKPFNDKVEAMILEGEEHEYSVDGQVKIYNRILEIVNE